MYNNLHVLLKSLFNFRLSAFPRWWKILFQDVINYKNSVFLDKGQEAKNLKKVINCKWLYFCLLGKLTDDKKPDLIF